MDILVCRAIRRESEITIVFSKNGRTHCEFTIDEKEASSIFLLLSRRSRQLDNGFSFAEANNPESFLSFSPRGLVNRQFTYSLKLNDISLGLVAERDFATALATALR